VTKSKRGILQGQITIDMQVKSSYLSGPAIEMTSSIMSRPSNRSAKSSNPANVIATHSNMRETKALFDSAFLASDHLYFDLFIETTPRRYFNQKTIHTIDNHGRQSITQGALGQGVQDDSSHA
jgi:hypothetical protein